MPLLTPRSAMRTKRFVDRVTAASDGPIECAVCFAAYDEEPSTCRSCGSEQFRER